MKRILALVACCALVACDGGSPSPHRSSPASPRVSSPAAPTPAASRSNAGAERLPGITLIADLSAPLTAWKPVAFIPFGEQQDEVGALLKKSVASIPIVPPSFAIDRDGSIWLIDLVKRRIVHYSQDGAFLGDIGGLEFDRFSPFAQDLGFAAGRLFLLEFVHNTLQTNLRSVDAGIGPRRRVRVGTEQLLMSHFMSPQPDVLGRVVGTAGGHEAPPTGGGTVGEFTVDPDTGEARPSAGVALPDGSSIDLLPKLVREGQTVLIRHVSDEQATVRAISVRVVPGDGDDRRLPAEVGWGTYCALPHGFASYVLLSPARPPDQDRYGGGQWLFEYSDDGQPIVWERLPESPLDAAEIYRHLAEGLDGHLYLMLAERGGMRIYRRPGPPES